MKVDWFFGNDLVATTAAIATTTAATATVSAATTTAATTATAATAAESATAAATAAAFFAGPGFVDRETASVNFLAAELRDGRLGFCIGGHGDEGEAA